MLQEARFYRIVEHLNKNGASSLQDLANAAGVSIGTIRRDLRSLEKSGLLKIVRGGAVAKNYDLIKQTFDIRQIDHVEEKGSLSEALGSIIKEGQFVALNGGTTQLEVARYLVQHYSQLTILTTNLRILRILESAPNFIVIVPGGILDHEEYTICGRQCEDALLTHNVDTALLAVNAISLHRGITDFRLQEISVMQSFLKCAKQRFVVADHSKFDRVACMTVCGLNDIDGIITDAHTPQELLGRYEYAGVNVIIPNV